MAWRSRAHAPSPGVFQPAKWKMDANGPIAPQISALRRAFPAKKPRTGTIAASGPASRPLISGRNLLGCHSMSSAREDLGSPQPGSALHHVVTALRVQKAWMIGGWGLALSLLCEPSIRLAHKRTRGKLGADA